MASIRIYLIHWNEEQRLARAEQLAKLGFDVVDELVPGSKLLGKIEELRPQAIIIDLTRIPSQGRDLGVALRRRKGTRGIPLIFAGGEKAKVDRIKTLLFDAHFCDWDEIGSTIVEAVNRQPTDVFVPDSDFAAYKHKPLIEKLGISEGNRVLMIGAPPNLDEILGELPEGSTITTARDEDYNLALYFGKTVKDLNACLETIVEISKQAPIWLAWPKKASDVASDLSQAFIREVCMDAGMVDYKICSIDSTWSALLFKWRG